MSNILKTFKDNVARRFELKEEPVDSKSFVDIAKNMYLFLDKHPFLSWLEDILTASKSKDQRGGAFNTKEYNDAHVQLESFLTILEKSATVDTIKDWRELDAAFLIFLLLHDLSRQYFSSEKFTQNNAELEHIYLHLEALKKSYKNKLKAFICSPESATGQEANDKEQKKMTTFITDILYPNVVRLLSDEAEELADIEKAIHKKSKQVLLEEKQLPGTAQQKTQLDYRLESAEIPAEIIDALPHFLTQLEGDASVFADSFIGQVSMMDWKYRMLKARYERTKATASGTDGAKEFFSQLQDILQFVNGRLEKNSQQISQELPDLKAEDVREEKAAMDQVSIGPKQKEHTKPKRPFFMRMITWLLSRGKGFLQSLGVFFSKRVISAKILARRIERRANAILRRPVAQKTPEPTGAATEQKLDNALDIVIVENQATQADANSKKSDAEKLQQKKFLLVDLKFKLSRLLQLVTEASALPSNSKKETLTEIVAQAKNLLAEIEKNNNLLNDQAFLTFSPAIKMLRAFCERIEAMLRGEKNCFHLTVEEKSLLSQIIPVAQPPVEEKEAPSILPAETAKTGIFRYELSRELGNFFTAAVTASHSFVATNLDPSNAQKVLRSLAAAAQQLPMGTGIIGELFKQADEKIEGARQERLSNSLTAINKNIALVDLSEIMKRLCDSFIAIPQYYQALNSLTLDEVSLAAKYVFIRIEESLFKDTNLLTISPDIAADKEKRLNRLAQNLMYVIAQYRPDEEGNAIQTILGTIQDKIFKPLKVDNVDNKEKFDQLFKFDAQISKDPVSHELSPLLINGNTEAEKIKAKKIIKLIDKNQSPLIALIEQKAELKVKLEEFCAAISQGKTEVSTGLIPVINAIILAAWGQAHPEFAAQHAPLTQLPNRTPSRERESVSVQKDFKEELNDIYKIRQLKQQIREIKNTYAELNKIKPINKDDKIEKLKAQTHTGIEQLVKLCNKKNPTKIEAFFVKYLKEEMARILNCQVAEMDKKFMLKICQSSAKGEKATIKIPRRNALLMALNSFYIDTERDEPSPSSHEVSVSRSVPPSEPLPVLKIEVQPVTEPPAEIKAQVQPEPKPEEKVKEPTIDEKIHGEIAAKRNDNRIKSCLSELINAYKTNNLDLTKRQMLAVNLIKPLVDKKPEKLDTGEQFFLQLLKKMIPQVDSQYVHIANDQSRFSRTPKELKIKHRTELTDAFEVITQQARDVFTYRVPASAANSPSTTQSQASQSRSAFFSQGSRTPSPASLNATQPQPRATQ